MTNASSGWLNGFIGMAIFSGSLPATRLAIASFDPYFLTAARAALAGLLALAIVIALRPPLPRRGDAMAMLAVALGVVVGFPLLTALALRYVTAAHALVFVGLLPLATASFGVWWAGERPRPAFWLFAGIGSAIVAGHMVLGQDAGSGSPIGDGLMLLAIAACGAGYAQGGKLARRIGGWQVICWGLILSMPLSLPLTLLWLPQGDQAAPASLSALLALLYVAVFSMLIGFFFWYRGLAQGGIAAVGQLQLLQPLLGLGLAALLLGEPVEPALFLSAAGVAAAVGMARRFA